MNKPEFYDNLYQHLSAFTQTHSPEDESDFDETMGALKKIVLRKYLASVKHAQENAEPKCFT